jgi:RNase P/RNase MRP subunit p30
MEEYKILNEKNFNKLKIEIEKIRKENLKKTIIFSSENDDYARQVIEKAKIDILLIPLEKRKDFSKQRNSGLNEILANIAKKNKIEIGINLQEILKENKDQKSKILARVIQNISLCRKKKLQIKIIPPIIEKRKKMLFISLCLTLGMPTWMIKNI